MEVIPDSSPLRSRAEILATSKRKLRALRRAQTESFLRIAEEVAALKNSLAADGEPDLRAWLRSDAGFSDAEVQEYLAFDAAIARKSSLLMRHRISPDTIRAIIGSDKQTRSECFFRIESEKRLEVRDVERIGAANCRAGLTADETAELLWREWITGYAARLGEEISKAVAEGAEDLLSLMNEYLREARQKSELDELPSVGKLMERAAAVERKFDLLFKDALGDVPDPEVPTRHVRGRLVVDRNAYLQREGERDVMHQSTRVAKRALVKLSAGRFDLAAIAEAGNENGSIRAGMEFLAGRRWTAGTYSMAFVSRGPSPKPLTFVDLDAGFGASALGLQAAGFEPLAVYVRDEAAWNVLKTNRRSWDVRRHHSLGGTLLEKAREAKLAKRDKLTKREKVEELKQLAARAEQEELLRLGSLKGEEPPEPGSREIDLPTSGLPWHHYDGVGERLAREDALLAVELIRPKVFLFEVLAEDTGDQRLARRLKAALYDVVWHEIDVSRLGVAQAATRTLLIGFRNGLLRDFLLPVINPPRRCYLSQVLGPLLMTYAEEGSQTPAGKALFVDKVREWVKEQETALVPPFRNGRRNMRVAEWARRGIDVSAFANLPPRMEDLANASGFKLNMEMLKALQGFPSSWKTTDSAVVAGDQVAGALPPVAAKAIGLAIYSALTGVQIDYGLAVAKGLTRPKQLSGPYDEPGEPLESVPPAISDFIISPYRTLRLEAGRRKAEARQRQLQLRAEAGGAGFVGERRGETSGG